MTNNKQNVNFTTKATEQLHNFDWDTDEIVAAIPTMFPNGKNIELVSASDDYLSWIVDGKEYTTDVEGKIVE